MDDNPTYATPDPGSDQEESEYKGLNVRLFAMAPGKKEIRGNIKGEPTTCAEAKHGEIKIKMTPPQDGAQDIADRDPTTLNTQVRVGFEQVFAEPEGMRSFNSVWRLSHLTFINTKFWCYRMISLIFAVPAAILWGLWFALLTFMHIWCVVPCIKATFIKMQCAGQLFSILVRTFVDPVYTAFAKVFSNIHITTAKE